MPTKQGNRIFKQPQSNSESNSRLARELWIKCPKSGRRDENAKPQNPIADSGLHLTTASLPERRQRYFLEEINTTGGGRTNIPRKRASSRYAVGSKDDGMQQ